LTCFSAAVLLIRSLYFLFFTVVLLFDSTRRNASPHINQLCRLRHFMLYCNLMSWTHNIIFFMNEATACCHLHRICWLMAIFAGLLSGLCGYGCCMACSSSQNSLALSDLRGVPYTAFVFHPLTHMPVTLYCCHGSCPPLSLWCVSSHLTLLRQTRSLV